METSKLTEAIISDVYLVDPYKVKFDEKLVDFNESKDAASYESLLMQIKEDGQVTPIYIRDGLVIDGRHRCKIAKELSIQVRAVDVDPALPDDKAVLLSNSNIFGGRNNSATQLAIKAFMLVEKFNFSDVKAISITGLKDKKAIGYVRRIKASKYDKKYNIIPTLLSGGAVQLMDPITNTMFRSRSVDKVKRLVAKLEEIDFLGDEEGDKLKTPTIDYDSMIDTETGKDMFWQHQKYMTSSDTKLMMISLLNKVFKPQETSIVVEEEQNQPIKVEVDPTLDIGKLMTGK